MQELNITEYTRMREGVGLEPCLASHTLEYNREANTSRRFNTRTSFVRVIATSNCIVSFDPDLSRTLSLEDMGTIILSGEPEYFAVEAGNTNQISAVKL